MKRLRQSLFNATRHSRAARIAVLLAIGAVVFLLVKGELPVPVQVSYRLPEGVRSLEVEYNQGGSVVRSARFAWGPDRSPPVVRHQPELAQGETRMVVTWVDREGSRRVVRRTERLDAERTTRVDLRP